MESELKGTYAQISESIRQLEEKRAHLIETQNTLTEKMEATGKTREIQKFDTLYGIAKKQNITQEVLIGKNPQITDPKRLMIGSIINL